MSLLANRRSLIGLALVVAVLGIGFATYFLGGVGGDRKPAAGTKAGTLHFEGVPAAAPLEKLSQFTLPFGERDGVAVSEGLSALEAVFSRERGLTYVVDHVASRTGARVRWYKEGVRAGEHFAPPGSALFASTPRGFAYVIAKGLSSHERLVLVTADGSVEGTFTVPLKINSGGILTKGDDLYVVAWSGFVDPGTKELTGNDVLVPVVVGGRQVTDAEARDGTVDGWRFGEKGDWQYRLVTSPGTAGAAGRTRSTLVLGHDELEVPYETVRLGVDASQRAWLFLPPHRVTERSVAGWPALADECALLAAVTAGGRISGAMPVRVTEGTFWPDISLARRFGFDGERLTLAEKTSSGVMITTYGVRP